MAALERCGQAEEVPQEFASAEERRVEATAQPVATQVVADPEPEAAPQYAVEEELGATGTQVVAREKVEMVMAGPQGGEVEGEQRVVLLVQGRSSTSGASTLTPLATLATLATLLLPTIMAMLAT